MTFGKVYFISGIMAFELVLSGCATPAPKMTDKEAQMAVYMIGVADTCVQKGYISNVSVAAHNRSLQQSALANRASQAQISAAVSKRPNLSNIPIQDCRHFELLATQVASERAQQQRQQQYAAAQPPVQYSAPYQHASNPYPQYKAPEVWSPNRPRNTVITCINASILTNCRTH